MTGRDPRLNAEGYPDPTAHEAIKQATGKDPRHQLRGKQNRAAGNLFEEMIRISLDWYREQGLANIKKVEEPVRQLGAMDHRGQFRACYEKKGEPDYKGTARGGRSVVFEAKHTDSDRIERSRLKPQQIEELELHHRLGAIAFVLVSFGFRDFYRVPWPTWRDMKQLTGRVSLKPEDLLDYRINRIGNIIHLLDAPLTRAGQEGAKP